MITSFSPPQVNTKEILRYARTSQPDPRTEALLQTCLDELLPLLSYRVCYKILPIERKGNTLYIGEIQTSSTLLHKALAECNQAVLFAATIGLGPDRLIRRYSAASPAKALLLQAIGAERAESLCNAFVRSLEQKGYKLRPRVSPGFGDLGLDMQRDIFKVLECDKIGLTLGENLLMIPSKSVTAFIGMKEGMTV